MSMSVGSHQAMLHLSNNAAGLTSAPLVSLRDAML